MFVYISQSDFIFTLDLACVLWGDSVLISALTGAVPAARKRGASSGGDWGFWAVSVLISSVTFKLSLEAAAAADHVRRALGCWGRISSAGSRGRGRRPGEGRPGAWGREPGRAGRRARRSRARPCLEPREDSPGKRSSPQPASRGAGGGVLCKRKKKTSALARVPSQVREFVGIVVSCVYLSTLVCPSLKPTSRSLFFSGKKRSKVIIVGGLEA